MQSSQKVWPYMVIVSTWFDRQMIYLSRIYKAFTSLNISLTFDSKVSLTDSNSLILFFRERHLTRSPLMARFLDIYLLTWGSSSEASETASNLRFGTRLYGCCSAFVISNRELTDRKEVDIVSSSEGITIDIAKHIVRIDKGMRRRN